MLSRFYDEFIVEPARALGRDALAGANRTNELLLPLCARLRRLWASFQTPRVKIDAPLPAPVLAQIFAHHHPLDDGTPLFVSGVIARPCELCAQKGIRRELAPLNSQINRPCSTPATSLSSVQIITAIDETGYIETRTLSHYNPTAWAEHIVAPLRKSMFEVIDFSRALDEMRRAGLSIAEITKRARAFTGNDSIVALEIMHELERREIVGASTNHPSHKT
jgi:hypothetical protein